MANEQQENGFSTENNAIRPCSEEVKVTALLLGRDIVRYVTKNNQSVSTSLSVQIPNPTTMAARRTIKTLHRTVDDISQKHEYVFRGMLNKMSDTLTVDNMEFSFKKIVDEMFIDNRQNWGRIVTVYTVGGQFAKHATEKNLTNNVDFIGEMVGKYIADNWGWWIDKNGGWAAFRDYFAEDKDKAVEDLVWRGLLATAGFGLAALAAVVAVR